MGNLSPSHAIRVDLGSAELFFAIGGYWTLIDMQAFLFEMGEQAKPLLRTKEPFDAIGDLSEFVPQDRETAEAIRETMLTGQRNGLRRFAVVSPNTLVKLQYRRITQGLEVEFFDSVAIAREWLRGDQANPIPNPIPA